MMKVRSRFGTEFMAVVAFVLVLTGTAHAGELEDGSTDFHGKQVTEGALIDALTPADEEAAAEQPRRTRGFRTRSIRPTAPKKPKAVSLEILFATNSAELSQRSLETLNILGKALQSDKLSDFTFVIEGHTDASGSFDYNLTLSERRAQAVHDYLKKNYNIKSKRLRVIGKGEQELADTQHPVSAKNRRVKIVNLGTR
ncbi:MAG: OmpA family protein [Magnetococcales bacterium]|nr:OmpA family protein [Magnetococcales bacterium]